VTHQFVHPFCKACGWRKGGVDSWDGQACKCGLSEPAMPYVAYSGAPHDGDTAHRRGWALSDNPWPTGTAGHRNWVDDWRFRHLQTACAADAPGGRLRPTETTRAAEFAR